MIRERLDNWCEKGILILVLAVFVFGPLATGAVRPLEFLIIQGLTSCAVLLWLLRFWLNPGHRLLWPPICWTVVAFVIFAIVRYRQAEIEYVARQELIRILVYAILFFIVLNNFARQEFTQLFSGVLVFLGVVISVYAIYQFATGSEYVWHFIKPAGYRARGSGTYICPNHLAGFLEMLVPLGLAYTLTGRQGYPLRIFLAYASLVMLAGIGITVSRGGWLASGSSLLIFFALLVRQRRHRISALAVLILLTAGAFAFYARSFQIQQRVQRIFTAGTTDDAHVRLWLAKPTLQMWRDHFWFGVGPAHFDYRFPAYRPVAVQARPGYAHNDYLNTLADWGLVGTSLVTSALVLLFAGVFKAWRFVRREQSELHTKPSNRTAFVLGASLGLVAILVHSLTDFNMHVPANAILAIALMALLSAHLRFATEKHWITLHWPGRLLATAVISISVVYLAQQGWRRAREYVQLDQAGKEKSYSRALFAALKEANRIEPMNFETTYAMGEALRNAGWDNDSNGTKTITEASGWFRRGIRLDPYDPYSYMRLGMCLDWLGRHNEAGTSFHEALAHDPNNYYILAHQGWHFVQTEDYATAKLWFERSIKVKWWDNPIAYSYLAVVERKLKETLAPSTP